MKNILFTLTLFFIASIVYSQARIVINDEAFIVIDNAAFVVLANNNANALATINGGNIVSEAEDDVIQWEIGETIGTYVIPWTTSSGVKIPLTIDKTTTGSGINDEFILSTWETTDIGAMNLPYPSAVSNMNYNGVDKSLFVADRFWHIDALSYTAKPDVTLSIAYDDNANEIGFPNTIAEANLQAQRFNTGLGHWESSKLFGTANTGSKIVSGIVVPSADFYEDWILVDNTNPLPVELVDFIANCEDRVVNLNWSTEIEINNDFFVVEKSYDGINFFELTTVQGTGNNSYYTALDPAATGVSYYKLKQVDFNGDIQSHKIVSTSCIVDGFIVDQLVIKKNSLEFNVSAEFDEDLTISFYDTRGRVVSNKVEYIQAGNNSISLSDIELMPGIYMLSIVGDYNSYSTKVFRR